MKLTLALAFGLLTSASGQTTPETEIAKLEAELGQAMIHKNVDRLAELVGDDWTIQQDSEQLGMKAGFLRDIGTGTLVVKSFKLRNLRVRVFGDVAVVQAFDDEVSSYNTNDGSGTYSWLDVWTKRNGHWVSVATQLTKVRSAREGIDAGNKAWIDGVKTGDIARIAATYTDDAVDCDAVGQCIRGRAAIEQHMRSQMEALGRAQSAEVKSLGSTQEGAVVYEWGQAEATFAGGRKLVERYLTAWRKQPDGSWKIFRNLLMPER